MSEAKITWHPVRLVPYNPEKHADLFDEDDEKPELIWEGDLPYEEEQYLITTTGGFVDTAEFCNDDDDVGFGFYDDRVIAWAELPEPYKQEES